MKRSIHLLPLALLLATVACVSSAQLSETAAWAADLSNQYRVLPNITYAIGSNYECQLDVYQPRTTRQPTPVLIYFHGGGWVAGTKESSLFALVPYIEMGFAVVNVEYRLARVATAPAAVEDCRLALRWVFMNAGEYNFDTTKVVVTGHSAGGHLALTTGMLPPSAGFDHPREWDRYGGEPKAAAIINWFGITDVRDLLAGPNRQQYAVSWFGSMTNREELAIRVSPLTYVRNGLPPILTIHGDQDQLVPYSHAVRLHEALSKANVVNRLFTVRGGRHGGFTREETLTAYALIRSFLKEHGLLPQ